MNYPKFPDLERGVAGLREFVRLKFEYGSSPDALDNALKTCREQVWQALRQVEALPEDPELARLEPDDLEGIRRLRPQAERVLWHHFDSGRYEKRLAGAFLGRMAGCTLGAPVEFWPVEEMHDWAGWIGDDFPPRDYWSAVPKPYVKRYQVSPCQAYTRSGLNAVPVDDDVTYTVLGLLIAERCGLDFTVADVGDCWLRWLPYACTAEDVALQNLRAGMAAERAAEKDNPFVQWIGADIRSDPWGYLAPGLPEKAAAMAWQDARLSHRRNGVFGAMFFSAAIAAAFALASPLEALRIGLGEIPQDCLLARDIRWALAAGPSLTGYADAREAIRERFCDMSGVHTNLNACLTIFGLLIGKDDFTRCIGETVAMGYDNDCTAATVGSLFGAAYGLDKIPESWYRPFNNKVLTYLNGHPELAIDDLCRRFARLAGRQFS